MMNNKNLARLAILTLCLTFVSTSLLGGTLAKYTSNVTASATATVADWSIEVNGDEITVATPPTVTFDLFTTTVKEVDGETTDTEVATGTGALIAPGTGGEFNLVISNASEVSAEYTIELSEENDDGIPIVYSVDDGATWREDITALATLTGTLAHGATATSETKTIKWKWVFEKDDAGNIVDTNLGIAGTKATVAVTADITVNQLD